MEAGGGGGGGRDVFHQETKAEEEAVKRNTDCVYFLASPLTCKKGSECEYRHSEGARVNPRDCWYWLNGNCLNPKCSFRHPPLDSLYGSPGTTSGPVAPVSHTVSSMQMPATHASAHKLNKQNVPCYYFQKGGCIKGDRCPFMHGPQTSANPGPTTSSVPQLVAKAPASLTMQSQSLKKDSWGPKECTTQQPKINVEKPIKEQPSTTKPAIMAEASSNNGSVHKKSSLPYILDNELRKSQPPHVSLKSNDVQSVPHGCQLRPTEEHFQSGREADEFLAESSPGFDVLVDVNGEDPDYFHSEDDYGRASVQDGRTQNPTNDFDYHHADYEHTPQFERDTYNGMDEYEQDGRVHSRHSWEQQRRSSERILDRQLMHDRRALGREEIPNEVDGLDLRHRLLKLRRLNGQRSAVSPDRPRESYRRVDRCIEDRDRSHNLGRDEQEYLPESSISSRLQGRITLPRRSSPDAVVELQSKKERDRGRHRGRLLLAPPISNCPGMQFDRIRRKADEEFSADLRNSGCRPNIKDDVEFMDFAGPKSLAELKGEKIVGSSQNQLTNKQRSMKPGKAVGHQESEGSLTFEGPKPLSVILKRKRETTHGNSAMSSSGDENLTKGTDGTSSSVSAAATTSMRLAHSSEAGRQWNNEVEEEEEEEGLICAGGEELHDDGHSTAKDELEVEDGMIMEAVDDHDLENHEQREESDYEVTEGGDFRTEDDEELDDEDDFARKVGMILS